MIVVIAWTLMISSLASQTIYLLLDKGTQLLLQLQAEKCNLSEAETNENNLLKYSVLF